MASTSTARRWANVGENSRPADLDVLCASGPDTIAAARRATTTVPLVGVDLETDPVASGLTKTLARPGGNVTGIFMDLPELGGKLIQLLREIVPGLARLGIVWYPDVGKIQFEATDSAAAICAGRSSGRDASASAASCS